MNTTAFYKSERIALKRVSVANNCTVCTQNYSVAHSVQLKICKKEYVIIAESLYLIDLLLS